jgi:hypothetical protein
MTLARRTPMPQADRRKRRTKSEWTEILNRFRSSGLTTREFCRREGLSLSSFQRWRSRLRETTFAEFVELVPEPTAVAQAPEWSLEIALPNGAQLRFRG